DEGLAIRVRLHVSSGRIAVAEDERGPGVGKIDDDQSVTPDGIGAVAMRPFARQQDDLVRRERTRVVPERRARDRRSAAEEDGDQEGNEKTPHQRLIIYRA